MNTPLQPALHQHADVAHAIYLAPYLPDIPLATMTSSLGSLDRFMTILFARSVNNDVETARQINRGIEVLELAKSGAVANEGQVMDFVLAASRLEEAARDVNLPVSHKVIHRYRPEVDLTGAENLLEFNRDRMQALIELGYKDTVEHDCMRNHCVV